MAASDEFFAEQENLIKPGAAVHSPSTFGHKGQVYDGRETRRRRGPSGSLPPADACDWVIVRLGAPGVVHAVVVDTAHFTGNFPQSCSMEACDASGYPGLDGLSAAQWTEIVPRSPLQGDTSHVFSVPAGQRCSHVRLRIYPDGGVARLRLHGSLTPAGLAQVRRRWAETAPLAHKAGTTARWIAAGCPAARALGGAAAQARTRDGPPNTRRVA